MRLPSQLGGQQAPLGATCPLRGRGFNAVLDASNSCPQAYGG